MARSKSKTSGSSLQTLERDGRALALRKQHLTYDQIAEQLGLSSKSAAYAAVQRALARVPYEAADEVRQIENERLEQMARRTLAVMVGTHVRLSGGEIVRDEHGNPLTDPMPVLKAVDSMLKIMERRARLLGLDAPVDVNMITSTQVDIEIARLSAELLSKGLDPERIMAGEIEAGEEE